MPLTRLNDEAFADQLEGVCFGMMTDKGTTVQCFVSHAVLTDKARASGQGAMLEAFHKYRVSSRTLRVPNTTQATSKSMVVSPYPATTSIQSNFHRV
jgi:hypothetical protein